MATQVTRNEKRSRYELTVDDELVGVADFDEAGDAVVIPHTEITPERRGRGLGAVLVRGVLDDLRSRNAKVVPACWYVRDYIEQHPEDADLLAH
jgi:predicted GNAT family acetyltransferase